MILKYKDFFTAAEATGLFTTKYEDLPSIVARANDWIAGAGVQVVSVETLVVPNLLKGDPGPRIVSQTIGDTTNSWYQVVRIWYQ